MVDQLSHRGPDDFGYWLDKTNGLALGHRRLAILDISPTGHQPMRSACGRYVIVYNGEVYNYREIRKELEDFGYGFKGNSDTEIILAAISHWGLIKAIERFVGMFAFALWDCKEHKLILVRDRLGIKPLYYGYAGKSFIFASELKAIVSFPNFTRRINLEALALFTRYNYVPAPFSIYESIVKLLPGYLAIISENGQKIEEKQYWSAVDVAQQGIQKPFIGSTEEAIKQLETLLLDAVGCRMIADVPLGAFLSGGIDSSTVVALMQSQSTRPIKTFSIGNVIDSYDEARYANKIAQYLGTDHTELYITPDQALEVIPSLPTMFDEPFADSSQIPTFLVSKLAREKVTVSLSGDGGDELFGGYNRHQWAPRIWNRCGHWPVQLRKMISSAMNSVTPREWDKIFNLLRVVSKGKINFRMPGYKIQKLAGMLQASSPEELYKILASHWTNPTEVVKGVGQEPDIWTKAIPQALYKDFTAFMMFMDLVTYLPDDILTKIDRASMAVSLEARVPLIDHRLVEFAWKLPMDLKIRNGCGKWILRQVLYRYVPKSLIERPKTGFGIPLDAWLRGPLREWVEALIDESRLKSQGFFYVKPIRQKWLEHLAGKRNWAYHLWDVLMFQAWLETIK